jgi:hypothetical protein
MSIALLALLVLLPQEKISEATRKALDDYLRAPAASESPALVLAVKALKGNLTLATEAVRSHPPLTVVQPGTKHGLKFVSGGKEWEYSIRLPADYDGKKRFPVLVLPDHVTIGPEDGIATWQKAKEDVEKYILFRPVIIQHQKDPDRFPQDTTLRRDYAMAQVMADGLTHLRLNYAADADRIVMTGLSQAGYYTYVYAAALPDQFAGIIPESTGGTMVKPTILPLAANLKSVAVRVLHAKADEISPYADAEMMRDAIVQAGGKVDFITYEDADFPGDPGKRHPGPFLLRLNNVLPWGLDQKREIPSTFSRVIRYGVQGAEGRWRVAPPENIFKPKTVTCSEEKGVLTVKGSDAIYLVAPEDIIAKKTFQVGKTKIQPKADLQLLLRSFKALGDPRRLAAAEILVAP